MILSILIPTYNRCDFLLKNLVSLKEIICKGNYLDDVQLIISNNFSSDNTNSTVHEFINNNPTITINYYNQEENIGLEKNALFVLEKANTDYVMYLGDDDFIDYEYLQEVMSQIINTEIRIILPSFIPVDLEGNRLNGGRDYNIPKSIHKKGFKNCFENSWRGHQLSGLVFKKDKVLEAYRGNEVNNIYLFIYFVAYSCLMGDSYHFTDYPVRVTQPGQENKDWSYGEDGLIGEVFDNYEKLPLSFWKKDLLQIKFILTNFTRLKLYKRKGIQIYLRTLLKVWTLKNSGFIYKLFFPLIISYLSIKDFLSN